MPKEKSPLKSANAKSPKHPASKRPIEQYDHKSKTRINNPPVGLVTPQTDPPVTSRKTYAYDPHLDPQLVWAGKKEHTSFEVPTVSLHVHERIDPRTIIEAVRKRNGVPLKPAQGYLFETREENPPLREAVDFYRHAHGWTNRLIAGDSLLVMNSLLEKEGLAGQVQMVYIDPPYGIRYGSNFQPFVNRRDVKDGKDEDLTQEPEMVRAFRDTWELGIHSYLTYLRDRLLLARDLLHESGSVFVQISDENVHLIRGICDEVFGAQNFFVSIFVRKKGSQRGNEIRPINDYLLWYCRDRQAAKRRFIYDSKMEANDLADEFDFVEFPDGTRQHSSASDPEELRKYIEQGAKLYVPEPLTAGGEFRTQLYPVLYEGRTFRPPRNNCWKFNEDGMKRIIAAGRLHLGKDQIRFKKYHTDFPYQALSNLWSDLAGASDKIYVVQTATKAVQRCVLMTTDPGDLVFDPTCGSGTTAFVAEQWGRRWITCDTSRVATTLAKQRLMSATFDYYKLAHPNEGVGSGFQYKTVPHITSTSIAADEPPSPEALYDQPLIDNSLARVSGPFTVEAVPAPNVKSLDELPGGKSRSLAALGMTPSLSQATQPALGMTGSAPQPQPADASIARSGPTLHPAPPREGCHSEPPVFGGEESAVSGSALSKSAVSGSASPSQSSIADFRHAATPLLDASIARSGPTLRQSDWRDELLKSGLRGKGGQMINFSRVEPLGGTRWLHADAETKGVKPERVVISFGPDYAPLVTTQVEMAWEEARTLHPKPEILVFAAFQFDPEAAKDIDDLTKEKTGMTFLTAQMNADLLTDDLKKKRTSSQSFWLVGRPEVEIRLAAGKEKQIPHPAKSAGIRDDRREGLRADENLYVAADENVYVAEVRGFDYYDTRNGTIKSGDTTNIAMWLLDTDYDGRSLYPRQVFFPLADEDEGWAKLARNLKAEIDPDLIEKYRGTVSLPFALGEHKRVAIKVIDDRGIESLKVVQL